MFKIVAFLKRREGISLAEMKAHYEERHLPLALSTFPQIIRHNRNYIDHGSAHFGPDAEHVGYDAISEIWFEDRAGFDAMVALLADPDASAALREDEQRFLDTARCGMAFVEEKLDPRI